MGFVLISFRQTNLCFWAEVRLNLSTEYCSRARKMVRQVNCLLEEKMVPDVKCRLQKRVNILQSHAKDLNGKSIRDSMTSDQIIEPFSVFGLSLNLEQCLTISLD